MAGVEISATPFHHGGRMTPIEQHWSCMLHTSYCNTEESMKLHDTTKDTSSSKSVQIMLKITSSIVGFTTNCPQILPIRIIPMGPPQGISDNISAADVALAAYTIGSCVPSEERTLAVTLKINSKSITNQRNKINKQINNSGIIPELHDKIQLETEVE
jgi:hypothetical protein